MYSSFSPDKIFHWKKPPPKQKKKRVKVLTKEQLVEIAEIRRKNMEAMGSIHSTRPSPGKMSVTKTGFYPGTEVMQDNQVNDQRQQLQHQQQQQQQPVSTAASQAMGSAPIQFVQTAPPSALPGSSISAVTER